MKYLLDTNVCIDLIRDRQTVVARAAAVLPDDLLLAGHAMSTGLIFVTDNVSEFQRVPGLLIENWRTA